MQRLKTRSQFQEVLAGTLIAKTPHFALHCQWPPEQVAAVNNNVPQELAQPISCPADFCVGVVVPKRWAKRAVTRNAIRRQVYAVATGFSDQYASGSLVVRLRSSFACSEFVSAVSDLLRQAVRAELHTLLHAGAQKK